MIKKDEKKSGMNVSADQSEIPEDQGDKQE